MISLARTTSLLLVVGGLGIICSATPTGATASTPQDRSAFIQLHGGIFVPAGTSLEIESGGLAAGGTGGAMLSSHWSVAGRLEYVWFPTHSGGSDVPAGDGPFERAFTMHQWIIQVSVAYNVPLGSSGNLAISAGLAYTLRNFTYEMTRGPDVSRAGPTFVGPLLGVALEFPLGVRSQSPLSLVIDGLYSVAAGGNRGYSGNHGGFLVTLGLGYSFGAQALE